MGFIGSTTNHELPITIVPLGIKKPLYSSSLEDKWGTASELVRSLRW